MELQLITKIPIRTLHILPCTKVNGNENQTQREKKMKLQSVHVSLKGGLLIHHYDMETDKINELQITFKPPN